MVSNASALTIGLALDVSGSMNESLRNNGGGTLSKLEGLQHALDALIAEAHRQSNIVGNSAKQIPVRIFAYLYGLCISSMPVCDLFWLVDASEGRSSDPELNKYREFLINDYERRLKLDARSVAMEVMGSDAYDLLKMTRAKAEKVVRGRIGEAIVKKILDKASTTGSITLTISQLGDRWKNLRTGLSRSSGILGGSTPMKECLRTLTSRFAREMADAPPDARYLLFVVSDGESGDGDPTRAATRLKRQGVEIVSCYVSSSNSVHAKTLRGSLDRDWPRGARTMFEVASRVRTGDPKIEYLQRSGWVVTPSPPGVLSRFLHWRGRESAKLFAQVNHSVLLEEYLKVVLVPLYIEQASRFPGPGSRA
jgi:von Willebrand factor type A domain